MVYSAANLSFNPQLHWKSNRCAYLSHKLSMATSLISNYFKRELFNP